MATVRQKHDDPVAITRAPGLLLGIGLGGFVDGILLHQVLQWHHMLTGELGHPASTVVGLEVNTFWDGIFHAGTWIAVAVGIFVLRERTSRHRSGANGSALLGWMFVGWGLFNLVEGLVDQQILGIHHVRDDLGGPLVWDIGFLVFGALLAIGGLLLLRWVQARRDPPL